MKILKRIAYILGGLVLLLALVAAGLYFSVNSRLTKNYNIQPKSIALPSDSVSIALGKHWADIHCAQCHGDNFGGKRMFEDASIGYIDAPNLTAGEGGIGASYSDTDFIRSIAHGVRPDKQPLLIMPSKEFQYFSARDLGAIIAYLKSVPPVNNTTHRYHLSFLAHIIAALGGFGDILGVELVNHEQRPSAPEVRLTKEYGKYIANTSGCKTCHGEKLSGGKDPNPQAPFAPNLTPGGNLGKWTEADFIKTLRTGFTPEQKPLQAAFMPWIYFGKMTDDELKALWMYLHAQPALETTE